MPLKTLLISIVLTSVYIPFISGQNITIEECQVKAEANYPAIAMYDIIEKTKEFNIANANKTYFPQGSFIAQGTWQSDVTSIDLEVPGFQLPTIDRDQFRVVAELNQLIWDGGRVSAQKNSIEVNAELDKRQLNNEIYTLKERVNNLYFGVLLIKEQINQLGILEKELQRNYDNVKAYMQNGVANESDLMIVRVERLKARQQRTNLESNLMAYIQMLSILIGEELNSDMVFVKPDPGITTILPIINRPEILMFEAQENALESQKSLLNAGVMPTIGAFAQAGYGKPGLNMFDNQFNPYFLGGVRLTWNFSNLYTLKSDIRKIDLQKSAVNSRREIFLQNLNIVIPQQQIEIEKYRKTMQDDEEIIRLHTQIRETTEIKVENGTMTVSDLMKEIIAEESAKQAKVLHEIQFLMSVYSLKYITNQN
jgi:outer membrane protein TolC